MRILANHVCSGTSGTFRYRRSERGCACRPSSAGCRQGQRRQKFWSAVRVASRRDALVLVSSPVAVFVRACILGLGGLFSALAGAIMSSRVVQSLASVRVIRDPFCTGSVEDSLVTMGMENRRRSVGSSTHFPIPRQCISCQANLTSHPLFPRSMNPSKTRSDSA